MGRLSLSPSKAGRPRAGLIIVRKVRERNL